MFSGCYAAPAVFIALISTTSDLIRLAGTRENGAEPIGNQGCEGSVDNAAYLWQYPKANCTLYILKVERRKSYLLL